VVVFASSSRLESMTVLRLRLCGKTLCNLPMEHRHFHYLKQAGWYHHIVEDIPLAVVSLTVIFASHNSKSCLNLDDAWLPDVLGGDTVAKWSLAFSISSILFGLLDKAVQMMVINASDEHVATGNLHTSLLGSTTGSLRSMTRRALALHDDDAADFTVSPDNEM
jgi:hypothetical protein